MEPQKKKRNLVVTWGILVLVLLPFSQNAAMLCLTAGFILWFIQKTVLAIRGKAYLIALACCVGAVMFILMGYSRIQKMLA